LVIVSAVHGDTAGSKMGRKVASARC
jgi:hypothetical protein